MFSGSGTRTTVFLWLRSSWIGDEEGSVVLKKNFLNFSLGLLVLEFLVVGDDCLRNSLSDCIKLGSITTSSGSDSDVDLGESLLAKKDNRFIDLGSEDSRFNDINWSAIHSDDSATSFAGCNSDSVLLASESLDEFDLLVSH